MRRVGNLMKKRIGIIIATIFFLHLTGTSIYANEIYTVKSGDSLWQIANKNGTTVEHLLKINNLKNDLLNIGQKLIVKESITPVIVEEPVSTPATLEETSTEPPAAIATETSSPYYVKSGDNLWKIARDNNTTVNNLMVFNNLASEALFIGQEILIPALTAREIPDSPSRAGSYINGDRVIQAAAQHLGTPYRYGGSGPGGFDCSGFVKYIFNKFDLNLNRTAASQYSHGVAVTKEELQIGDLVFFASGKSIDHVGIYSGDGNFIHSSSPRSGGVIYSSLSESYYARTYVGAKRIIN